MIKANIPAEIRQALEQPIDQRASAEHLRRIFEFTSIGMAITVLDGHFVQVNDTFCNMVGYTREELLLLRLSDVIHPDDTPYILELFTRLLAGEIPRYRMEMRYNRQDGESVFVIVHATLIRDAHDQPRHFIVQAIDITQRKQAEQVQRASEARYRAVVESQTELICRALPDGTLTFVNDACCRYSGKSRDELLGKNFKSLMPLVDQSGVWQRISLLNREHPVVAREHRVMTDDGEVRWQQWIDRAIFDGQENLIEIQSVGRDITDSKLVEQAIFQAHKMESLDTLANGIAHDFNNLLVSVLGQISLVQHNLPEGDLLRTHLNKAFRAAERGAKLVQQMLTYSGRGHFEMRPLSLNRLIQDCLLLFKANLSENIQLRDSLSSRLPQIKADGRQMQEVVMNLLRNSAEAIGDRAGTVTVTTGIRTINAQSKPVQLYAGESLPDGQYVTLRVQDDGAGMDANTSARIFDPFFTTKSAGQGLGLAAVLGIVRSYRGGVQVRSHKGKGTSFTLFFPTSPIERDRLASATLSPPTLAAIRNAATILVIDDEEMVREAVTDILEAEGYYVLSATNGASGIALYRKRMKDIALVLLDLSMPELNGEQTLEVLKTINSKVRVLISSGCSEQEVMLRFKREQVAGFVKKPYSADTLVAAIWRHLS